MRYTYDELRAAAISPTATQEDIDAFGEWFEEFGFPYWTGEYFDADDGLRLYPIYSYCFVLGADENHYEFR